MVDGLEVVDLAVVETVVEVVEAVAVVEVLAAEDVAVVVEFTVVVEATVDVGFTVAVEVARGANDVVDPDVDVADTEVNVADTEVAVADGAGAVVVATEAATTEVAEAVVVVDDETAAVGRGIPVVADVIVAAAEVSVVEAAVVTLVRFGAGVVVPRARIVARSSVPPVGAAGGVRAVPVPGSVRVVAVEEGKLARPAAVGVGVGPVEGDGPDGSGGPAGGSDGPAGGADRTAAATDCSRVWTRTGTASRSTRGTTEQRLSSSHCRPHRRSQGQPHRDQRLLVPLVTVDPVDGRRWPSTGSSGRCRRSARAATPVRSCSPASNPPASDLIPIPLASDPPDSSSPASISPVPPEPVASELSW